MSVPKDMLVRQPLFCPKLALLCSKSSCNASSGTQCEHMVDVCPGGEHVCMNGAEVSLFVGSMGEFETCCIPRLNVHGCCLVHSACQMIRMVG